jgi:hypothetical protein
VLAISAETMLMTGADEVTVAPDGTVCGWIEGLGHPDAALITIAISIELTQMPDHIFLPAYISQWAR